MNKKVYKFGYIALLLTLTSPAVGQSIFEDSVTVTDEWSIGNSNELQIVKPYSENITVNTTVNEKFANKNYELKIVKNYNYKPERQRRRGYFNGHWTGIYVGLTNYLTDGMIYSPNSGDMRLDWSGSRTFILNPYHGDISLSRNGCFGMTLGCGFEYQRLRFADDYTTIVKGEYGVIVPSDINREYDVRRNTLKHLYVTTPILFELQSKEAFISVGVIGGLRLHSKTKTVYDFEGDKRKMKNTDDFSMSPFKLDATAKIGYGGFAIFCNYTMTHMFERNKGLDLHPLTIGFGFGWGW